MTSCYVQERERTFLKTEVSVYLNYRIQKSIGIYIQYQ
jgi:hypothetical protein